MELESWRRDKNISYENLARSLDMTTSKVYRICKKDPCIRLSDAFKIVKLTGGEVDFCDMYVEGC
jgi:plasmid maintenance system antidote protein VapI